jgi:hydrogenase maturation protease
MTNGSADRVLVLALGNLLLGDDAAGLRLLELLTASPGLSGLADFVDGGTQGLALLSVIEGRKSLLILDAVSGSDADSPGFVRVFDHHDISALRARRASTAHEGNALEILEAAILLGLAPPRVAVVGITPARLHTGIGLSPEVEAALPAALAAARSTLESWSREPIW